MLQRFGKTIELDGIKFKSIHEAKAYETLRENGIKVEYEPKTYILQEKFRLDINSYDKSKGKVKWKNAKGNIVRPITYTPDFIFEGKKGYYIIEIKGRPNDAFPLKYKMFMKYLQSIEGLLHKYHYFLVYTKRQLTETINIIKALEGEGVENDEKEKEAQ